MYKSDINFNLYKTFYDVALNGSISKTATMNYTSQPAVSRAIKQLESELDTTLFYRNKNGIVLTKKGQELFFYVEQSYNLLMIAERAMLENETMDKGKISIGIPSHIATFYLFDAIDNFHKEYPNIEITIISKSTKNLLNLLRTHEIDFMIDSEPISFEDKDITIRHIKNLSNTFVVSSDIDVSEIKTVKDLEKYPLILPVKGTNNRNDLDEYFVKNDVLPENVLNIYTSEVIIGAIKRKLGIGYCIKDLVLDDLRRGFLKEVKFKGLPKIGISLVYIDKYVTSIPKEFLKKYYGIEI